MFVSFWLWLLKGKFYDVEVVEAHGIFFNDLELGDVACGSDRKWFVKDRSVGKSVVDKSASCV